MLDLSSILISERVFNTLQEGRGMLCTEHFILILQMRVVVECCRSGHVNMARCIRLFCAVPTYDILT